MNTPAFIVGRTTLGCMERPELQLLTAAGAIAFRNEAWNAVFPDNSDFSTAHTSSENVFAGDVIDRDHRRNLYRVIIGTQGVTLSNRLNDLDYQSGPRTTKSGITRRACNGMCRPA
jgi:hypothetical protein